MKNNQQLVKWTLNHVWIIPVSYISSIIVLLIIHGSFGFTMNDDGTYLSNALMHIGSGFILALGTGIFQKLLLKEQFQLPFKWVWSLIIGFVLAELLAGIVLWKMETYRGLINIFNASNHLPEALIFTFAGFVAGILQYRLLKPLYQKSFYWIISSALGWGLLILSTYIGLLAFLFGAFLYGLLTGLVLYRIMQFKPIRENLT